MRKAQLEWLVQHIPAATMKRVLKILERRDMVRPEMLVRAGLPQEYVAPFERAIFNRQDKRLWRGQPMRVVSVKAVYSRELVLALCRTLGVPIIPEGLDGDGKGMAGALRALVERRK